MSDIETYYLIDFENVNHAGLSCSGKLTGHDHIHIFSTKNTPNAKKRGEALLKAEADFNLWMDIYPESEPWQERLKIQKAHDEVIDKIGIDLSNQ